MNRPTVEVADIFRAQGDNFIDQHTLGIQQLKVIRVSIPKNPSARIFSEMKPQMEICASFSDSRLTGLQYRCIGRNQSCTYNPCPRTPDPTVVEVLLGSTPFVSVMQTADFGNRNNLTDRLYRPLIG